MTARPALQHRAHEFAHALTRLLGTPQPLRSLSTATAVDATDVTLRTVERRLRASGWPAPDRLRMWLAFFYLTYVAQLSGRSPTACARVLGGDANTVYRLKLRLLGSAAAFDPARPDALDHLARLLFAEHGLLVDLDPVEALRAASQRAG